MVGGKVDGGGGRRDEEATKVRGSGGLAPYSNEARLRERSAAEARFDRAADGEQQQTLADEERLDAIGHPGQGGR